MHSRYEIPREEAHAVAAKWKGAVGARFRNQGKAAFLAIFGDEYGEMLHEYRTQVFWAHERKRNQSFIEAVAIVVCFVVFFGAFIAFSEWSKDR